MFCGFDLGNLLYVKSFGVLYDFVENSVGVLYWYKEIYLNIDLIKDEWYYICFKFFFIFF